LAKRQTRNAFEKLLESQIKKAKVKFTYETEKIPYVISGNYIPDFIIETPHGRIYVEAKGYFRREAKSKMVAVKKQHPALDIRFVFYRYSKANEKWAIKYKFPYAFEKIPRDWLTNG
jgi:predicted nuclease of restriction endonuclease-like RecB superfamily